MSGPVLQTFVLKQRLKVPESPAGAGVRGSGLSQHLMAKPLDLWSGYKPVSLLTGMVHMKGGALRTSTPVATKHIGLGQQKIVFVKMSTNDQWLLKATTGCSKFRESAFGRTSLLDDMRQFVQRCCNGDVKPKEVGDEAQGGLCCEGTDEGGDEDYDPMNDVDVSDDDSQQKGAKTMAVTDKRMRYYKNTYKNKVVEMEVDIDPRELVGHPEYQEGKKQVRMFIADRQQLWLDIAELPWAVRYLWVQHLLKGVPLVAPDDAGPSGETSGQS